MKLLLVAVFTGTVDDQVLSDCQKVYNWRGLPYWRHWYVQALCCRRVSESVHLSSAGTGRAITAEP